MKPAPLALNSKRWRTLKAHFGNASEDTEEIRSVPKLLARWARTTKTYAEEYEYDPLRESFLHQGTILDIAYAVVPHLVEQLAHLEADRRIEVLDDVAEVEAVRLTPRSRVEAAVKKLQSMPFELREHFIQATRDRHPELPEDLAPAYLAAIAVAKKRAGRQWGKRRSEPMGPHRWRRHVRYLRAHGLTDDDVRFAVRALVTPDENGMQPVHEGGKATVPTLKRAAGAPKGFASRARFSTSAGKLAAQALHALAWIEQHAGLEKMLR